MNICSTPTINQEYRRKSNSHRRSPHFDTAACTTPIRGPRFLPFLAGVAPCRPIILQHDISLARIDVKTGHRVRGLERVSNVQRVKHLLHACDWHERFLTISIATKINFPVASLFSVFGHQRPFGPRSFLGIHFIGTLTSYILVQ